MSDGKISVYVLATHGHLDPKIADQFQQIEKRLAGKMGELFLVVRRRMERCAYCLDRYIRTEYVLGVLSSEELVLDVNNRTYGLPTKAYIEISPARRITRTLGPFLFIGQGFQCLRNVIRAGTDFGPGIEIIIGDDAVFEYSPFNHLPGHVPGSTPRPQKWVVALNRAARMLGKDVLEAPEEKEEMVRLLQKKWS